MELRFVARDAEIITLESDHGQRYQLPISDELREAIRANPKVQDSNFSPREIQNLIRSGKSLEEVASTLEVTVAAIEPFAAPILDELRFVLDAALSTQVPVGSTMQSFRELIQDQHPSAEFKAAKIDGVWIISATDEEELSWTFDPKTRHLEPANQAAGNLTRQHASRDIIAATAKSRPIQEPEVEQNPEPENLESASVHSLVDELRSRRNQETAKPATAKGRASLPSWDEIVLGASNSESDTD